MEVVESVFQAVLLALSRLLEPVAIGLARLEFVVRGQLTQWGVPYGWVGPIITGTWVIVLFMAVRAVSGWIRAVVLVVIALVLMKVYGFLPV